MKNIIIILLSIFITNIFAQRIIVNDSTKQFEVNGKRIWLNGTNTPWDHWNDFGGDFDYNWWENEFRLLSSYNINSTRIWITCDGQNPSLQIDTSGYISSVSEDFWEDVDSLMSIANRNRIYVMIALISFDHFKVGNENYLLWRKMINDETNRQSFVDNYAVPFVNRYKDNPFFFAVDVGNELDGVWDWEGFKLPSENVLDLIDKTVEAIHLNSEVLACQGFGTGIKYNTSSKGGTGNYLANIDVDFYNIHYYDWQNPYFGNPFDISPVDYNINSKPCIIGEATAKGSAGYSPLNCYKKLYAKGWQGMMPWTSNGVDVNGDKDDSAPGSNWFFNTYPELVYPDDYLTISPIELSYNAESTAEKIAVNSNINWQIINTEDWITISPASGLGSDTIVVTLDKNPGNNFRNAEIIVSNGNVKRIVTIKQKGLGQGAVQEIPVGDFDTGDLDPFYSWGAPLSIVVNPDGTPEDSVALLDQTSGAWNAITSWWESGDFFFESDSVGVSVYLNTAGSIKFYCDNSVSGAANYEKLVSDIPAKTWKRYYLYSNDMPSTDYRQFAVQYDQAGLIYFENFTLYKTNSLPDDYVLFDPSGYPIDSLNSNMEIVQIEGTEYLQVVVDEWNQILNLTDSVMIPYDAEEIEFEIKYASGSSGVNINNCWYKYLFQDKAGAEIFNAEGEASSILELSSNTTDCDGNIKANNGAYIKSLLIAGQNKSDWQALSGDTIWIGKTTFVNPTFINQSFIDKNYSFTLKQNYPNPFNPSTTICYSLPSRESVELTIYDITGRKITTLVNTIEEAGKHFVNFQNNSLASGTYFYNLKAGNHFETKKMLFLK